MCGNPRKFFKELTLQEKRAILSENDSSYEENANDKND
jgi:hypothetical protein